MVEMGIESSILQLILAGQKTVEGRLRTPKFVTLRRGDILSFREDVWHDDRLVSSIPNRGRAIITKTQFFDSFEAMFKGLDYRLAVPFAASELEAIQLYSQFYSAKQLTEHGVVAIYFTLQ